MPYKAAPITLDDQTRAELVRRVRAGTCPQREAKRARIILLAADGVSSRRISAEVGMHESHVAMWRQRFLAEGLEGLLDAERPGRPVTYGHDDRMKMAALACLQRDPGGSLRFCAWKDRRKIAAALKPIYTAVSVEAAEDAMDTFELEHGERHPAVVAT